MTPVIVLNGVIFMSIVFHHASNYWVLARRNNYPCFYKQVFLLSNSDSLAGCIWGTICVWLWFEFFEFNASDFDCCNENKNGNYWTAPTQRMRHTCSSVLLRFDDILML